MSGKQKTILIVLGLAILCALIALAALVGYSYLQPQSSQKVGQGQPQPMVLFNAPKMGHQVPVGQPVRVHVVASGPKIARVELWVDGQLHTAQNSSLSGGTSPFPLLTMWEPASAGRHTLIARAFAKSGERAQAVIEVEATSIDDQDGDGVADEVDACPDEAGWPAFDGCPDRDGDNVPDDTDACPDEAGLPDEGGCPVPAAGDRDGDSVPDDEDRCPDEPGVPTLGGCQMPADDPGDGGGGDGGDGDGGDGDGPGWGPPGSSHDADSDGDGIPDADDSCPGVPGLPENEGCPDRDGDTVPDYRDMCPDVAGPPENTGCPEDGPDRDGDGIPDLSDPCPDEAGLPEDGGCPPPEEEPEPVPPGPGDAQWPEGQIPTTVEFQALSFQVSGGYDGVYCYPSLAGEPVERHSFEPLGGEQWDIAAELGSRQLLTIMDQPIAVQMTCGADNVLYSGEGSTWGTYWGLGSVAESHPASDWDGHVITVRSSDGDDGRWFEAQYRLCLGTCGGTTFEPPILSLYHYGGDSQLIWMWDGDREQIDGFHVYVDGSRVLNVSPDATSYSVAAYAPTCGSGQQEFQVSAYSGGRESPLSNIAYWSRPACSRVVHVTFDQLVTFSTSDEEHDCLGPIFGLFTAEGSEPEYLAFDGADDHLAGFRLCPHSSYGIQEMFDTIWSWGLEERSREIAPYNAPTTNSITVELGPYDDLTFGAAIYEWDRSGLSPVYREAFVLFWPMASSEVRSGRYMLRYDQIQLDVLLDVSDVPGSSATPDLTITNVDTHEPSGQLRVHVLNNAADMLVPEDIVVHWVSVDDPGTVLGSITWQDVQISSGESLILQGETSLSDIGGLLFIIDPDAIIPDGNRDNNTFETPP